MSLSIAACAPVVFPCQFPLFVTLCQQFTVHNSYGYHYRHSVITTYWTDRCSDRSLNLYSKDNGSILNRTTGGRDQIYFILLILFMWTALLNPLKPELNPICYLLALLGAHHFLHVNRIRVKLLTFRLLMSYIYGAPILDVSRSHTTTQHSR